MLTTLTLCALSFMAGMIVIAWLNRRCPVCDLRRARERAMDAALEQRWKEQTELGYDTFCVDGHYEMEQHPSDLNPSLPNVRGGI